MENITYRISSYSCRGNYSFLNSSSEETIQGEETIQERKLYEEIRYVQNFTILTAVKNEVKKTSLSFVLLLTITITDR